MLRVRLAAETGMVPKPRATALSAAERTSALVPKSLLQFFIDLSFI
jgi:hypothetical protein